jgi:DNA repair protein RadC
MAKRASSNYTVKEVRYLVAREPEASSRRAILSAPVVVVSLIRDIPDMIPDDAREHFVILMLGTQNHLIAWHRVATGTLSSTLVQPREVFGPAFRHLGVASLILVHNHPSGDPTPSRDDVRLTRDLADAAKLLGLNIHDHVVIGNGTSAYASFSEQGLI